MQNAVLLFVFAFDKNTYCIVFEANICVGSRHQQRLISSRMTDGKDNEKITERALEEGLANMEETRIGNKK